MLIIGHRGGSGDLPENTISAFQKAIDLKLNMIELDVHLTRDGEVVIHHDTDVSRQTGRNGRIGRIGEMSLSELRELDFAAYKKDHHQFERIVTLEELFQMIPPEISVNIEIKNYSWRKDDLAARVIERIREAGREKTVLVSAYDHILLKEVHELAPDIKKGVLLYARLVNPLSYIRSLGFPVYSVHPAVELVDKTDIRILRGAGYEVFLYTVNSREEYDFALDSGSSGIFTDYPEALCS
jgi:glycerophosphoryl diester phosphodiesterase